MKPIMTKFQILIHNNNFRLGILFYHISVMFSEIKLINIFKTEFTQLIKNPLESVHFHKPYTPFYL